MADDPLRRAFDDVRAGALPHVRRPGVEAAQATVRRRRQLRVGAALVAFLLCGLGVALNPWAGSTHPDPATSSSPAPLLSDPPTPSTSPSAEALGGPSAPPCANDGRAILVRRSGNNITVRFSPDGGPNQAGILPCPGFFVAVYYRSWMADTHSGSAGDRRTLDSTHLTVTMTIWDADRCIEWLVGYHYGAVNQPVPEIEVVSAYGYVDWSQTPPRPTGTTYFWDKRHNRSDIVDGAQNFGPCPTTSPTP